MESEKFKSRRYIEAAVIIAVTATLWILVGTYFAIVFALICLAVLLDIDSRVMYIVALTLLFVSALLSAFLYEPAADWFASMCFFAFAIGVAVQLSQYVREAGVGNFSDGVQPLP